MWFDTWSGLLRVVLVGTAAYVWLVVVLRVSGKRTLAKLNAFDLVVTVALGSTLATILLSSDVAWVEGALALALLAGLQLGVAAITSRLPGGRSFVTARPTLVLRDGVVDHDAMRGQRLTEGEVRQAVRASGTGDLARVAAVVLESDGTLSVIGRSDAGDLSAATDVAGLHVRET
ncbi:DUF421 domain-containing protein [Aquipuribacter sp. MA13-13]|uniref:DUF421 domain-containing protein n=2 Tax=unclassified Aquipuribacter TaxID=2635084 RepID=UPI003EEA5F01